MLVFFRRLPPGTTKIELETFMADALKGGLFAKHGKITKITFIERDNPKFDTRDFHCIVSIEPDSAAQRVIQKLNRSLFKGKYIEIRRFHLRNPANDPRKNRTKDNRPDSRRNRERRFTMSGFDEGPKVTGIDNFRRKH